MAVDYPLNSEWSAALEAISPGPGGSFDVRLYGMMSPCAVIKLSGVYYVYYIGADGNRGDGGPANRALGVAYGADPKNLTKYSSNPIITFQPNVDEEEGVFSAAAFLEGGTIHLWYGGLRGTGGSVDIEIRYRSSTDGLTFSNDTLVYQRTTAEDTPLGACKIGSAYSVYYLRGLGGGEGPFYRLSGSSPTSLPTNTLVSGIERHGGGDMCFRDANTMFTTLVDKTTGNGLCYDIATSTPDTISSLLETYTGYRQRTLFLDPDNSFWLMYVNPDNSGDNKIYLLDTIPTQVPDPTIMIPIRR